MRKIYLAIIWQINYTTILYGAYDLIANNSFSFQAMTIYGQINTSQGQTAPPSSDTPTTLTDRGIDLNSAQFDLESNADSRADK